jgi:hypothetical protein
MLSPKFQASNRNILSFLILLHPHQKEFFHFFSTHSHRLIFVVFSLFCVCSKKHEKNMKFNAIYALLFLFFLTFFYIIFFIHFASIDIPYILQISKKKKPTTNYDECTRFAWNLISLTTHILLENLSCWALCVIRRSWKTMKKTL